MTKDELKKLIKDRFPDNKRMELIDWVLSNNFDKELDQFITEDLEHELLQKHKLGDADLENLASEILKKAPAKDGHQEIKQHKIETYQSDWQSRSGFRRIFRIAAAVVLIALFAYVAFYFTNNQTVEIAKVESIIKENQRGRKSTIFLRDGSIVYLNSESKIQYPEVFSDSLRVVHISGEAYFDIARDEAKPFIVYSDNLKISVLGTSFNVNAFQENEFVKVSLNTGKVKIENTIQNSQGDSEAIELVAGQSVEYSSEKNIFTNVSEFDPNLDLSWKDGKIVFKEASLEKVMERFERWYNVDITLKNSPYFKWNYTGEFHNQTLQDVLESLSFSQSFDFELDQDKVEIVFKPN